MNTVSQAIKGRYNDGSPESLALANMINAFSYRKVKNNPSYPYVTFFFVNGKPEYTFDDDNVIENTLFQIDIWSESDYEAGEIAEKVKAIYDDTAFTNYFFYNDEPYLVDLLGDYDLLRCYRESERLLYADEVSVSHYVIEYRIEIEGKLTTDNVYELDMSEDMKQQLYEQLSDEYE